MGVGLTGDRCITYLIVQVSNVTSKLLQYLLLLLNSLLAKLHMLHVSLLVSYTLHSCHITAIIMATLVLYLVCKVGNV